MRSPSPYYSKTTFYALTPLAVLYSLVSNAVVRVIPSSIAGTKSAAAPPALRSVDDRASLRVAIVTGSNTGIGFETARELVKDGFTVVLACRSRDKAEQAARSINNDGGGNGAQCQSERGEALFLYPLDLSSFKSVREFSQEVKLRFKRIDVLVNNAGRNSNGEPTEDGGLDLLFQSNFLGHYMLTCELLDLLQATAIESNCQRKGRIVNLSSVMHHFNRGHDVEDVGFWQRALRPLPDGGTKCDTYALSKLAAILFTRQLNERYGDSLEALAVSPGSVYSDIWRSSSRLLVFFYRFIYLSTRQGCQTSVDAATRADLPKSELAVYLQPYLRVPGTATKPTHPLFEMLGPFCGSVVTPPRLPLRSDVAAAALWTACEVVTKCHWKAEK
jgi:NAD(P)-dependent dehydrogenase (short-subunit alcohol dehydrogenase family)